MKACRKVCGPMDLLNPARRAVRRTIRPARWRSSRRPSAPRNTGPSQRSPMARSIARAVRDASGMVATLGAPIPPRRRDFIELGSKWLDETCWDCDHIWRQVTRTGASVAEKARLPSDCGGLHSADLDPLPGQRRRSGELVDELLVGDVVDARARVLAGHLRGHAPCGTAHEP